MPILVVQRLVGLLAFHSEPSHTSVSVNWTTVAGVVVADEAEIVEFFPEDNTEDFAVDDDDLAVTFSFFSDMDDGGVVKATAGKQVRTTNSSRAATNHLFILTTILTVSRSKVDGSML